MDPHFIIFKHRADEAEGLVEVAQRWRIDAFPDGVYAVGDEGLALLRELNLDFRIADKSEVERAIQGVRDLTAAHV
jgi:hypothetical protein